jgi:predicted alpha/beta hydrolase
MLHFVGHSLGGQAAGVAGGALKRRPARITGLDAASPLFTKLPLHLRLDKSDADFVDIIHTDAGIFGRFL